MKRLILLLITIFFPANASAYLKLSVLDSQQQSNEITLSEQDSKLLIKFSQVIENLVGDIDSKTQSASIPLPFSKRQLDLILSFLKFENEKDEKLVHRASQLPLETIESLLINSDYLGIESLQTIFERALARKITSPTELKKFLRDPSYIKSLRLPDVLRKSLTQEVTKQAWENMLPMLSSLKVENKIIAHEGGEVLSLEATGNKLCASVADGKIRILNLQTGKSSTLTTNPSDFSALVCKNPFAYSSDESGTITVWDLEKLAKLQELKKHSWAVLALTLNNDGTFLFSSGKDHALNKWDTKTGKLIATLETPKEYAWALVANDPLLFIGLSDGAIKAYDFINDAPAYELKGHAKRISKLIFDQSKKILFSADAAGIICAWDLEKKEPFFRSSNHDKEINTLAHATDGFLFSGGQDGTIRLWDDKTGQLLFTIASVTPRMISGLALQDNNLLISGSFDKTIRRWNLQSLKKTIHSLRNNLTLEQALMLVAPETIDFKKYPHLLSSFKNLDEEIQCLAIESKHVLPPNLSWSAPVLTGYQFLKSIFGNK
ncbi:WD40 repeat domain-containing protein [Candidatus Dependentiae bacterium]|nr:WD40 repeat domain-containing protein [Candidatus Dependentiae bacterium]